MHEHQGRQPLPAGGNVAPTIALSGASSVNEGASYTLSLGAVTDPGQDTVTSYRVNWGDGTADSTGSYALNTVVTHVYADGAAAGTPRTIPVEVTDENDTHAAASTKSVTVTTVARTAAITGPSSGVRGRSRAFTFSAADASSADQAAGFVYTITWGDGSPTQTIAREAGNGSGVSVEHVFTATGPYTVTGTATDQDNTTSVAATHAIAIVAVQMQVGVVSRLLYRGCRAYPRGRQSLRWRKRGARTSRWVLSQLGNSLHRPEALPDRSDVSRRVHRFSSGAGSRLSLLPEAAATASTPAGADGGALRQCILTVAAS